VLARDKPRLPFSDLLQLLNAEILFRKSREEERKYLARLTHEYMDGGAGICAESTSFSSAKNSFFADENKNTICLGGYPFCRAVFSARQTR